MLVVGNYSVFADGSIIRLSDGERFLADDGILPGGSVRWESADGERLKRATVHQIAAASPSAAAILNPLLSAEDGADVLSTFADAGQNMLATLTNRGVRAAEATEDAADAVTTGAQRATGLAAVAAAVAAIGPNVVAVGVAGTLLGGLAYAGFLGPAAQTSAVGAVAAVRSKLGA